MVKTLDSYLTIDSRIAAEIVEKKSRFIAQMAHVSTEEEALAFLEEIRVEHRMARHNVYAYVLREGGRVRYSDDGEPSKTAGLPTLETIQHAGLVDVIVVVTRYFGGTLLGTGGLVRAYTQATQAAIEAAELLTISRCVDIKLSVPYALYDQVLHLAGQYDFKVADSTFTDAVELRLSMLEKTEPLVLEKLRDLLRGQGSVAVGKPYDAAY